MDYDIKKLRGRHWVAIFVCFLFVSKMYAANPIIDTSLATPEFNEAEVQARFKELRGTLVQPQYTSAVKNYIKTYVKYKRDIAEKILGRSILYFPIFEQFLLENDLPTDLKYLAVVESALHPKATSRAGAVGLWQFMPATGSSYGLLINENIDERCDPVKSSAAAAIHLKHLHKRYGDWALALAAYNSGAGRVNRAIKRGRSKNFWTIQRYLPRETRNYVPAFLAANYLMKYHEEHGLKPNMPNLDMQITETVQVYSAFSFHEIAQITELGLDVIEWLNPSYRRSFIPENPAGYPVIVPARVATAFKEYLASLSPDLERPFVFSSPVYLTRGSEETEKKYIRSFYIVQEGETMESLAALLKCTQHQLKVWNKLKGNELKPGLELTVYTPKEYKKLTLPPKFGTVTKIITVELPQTVEKVSEPSKETLEKPAVLYKLNTGLKLSELAKKFRVAPAGLIFSANEVEKDKRVKAGTIVKIPFNIDN